MWRDHRVEHHQVEFISPAVFHRYRREVWGTNVTEQRGDLNRSDGDHSSSCIVHDIIGRGFPNFPSVQVRPSLLFGRIYEAIEFPVCGGQAYRLLVMHCFPGLRPGVLYVSSHPLIPT